MVQWLGMKINDTQAVAMYFLVVYNLYVFSVKNDFDKINMFFSMQGTYRKR